MKKKLKNFGVFSLMVGVSTLAMMYNVAKQQVPELSNGYVKVNDRSMSLYDFYIHLEADNNKWFYIDEDGNKTDVDSLCDSQYRTKQHDATERLVSGKKEVDTVHVEWEDNVVSKGAIYTIGAYKTKEPPSLGLFTGETINVRKFVSSSKELEEAFEQFDDKYNCTYRHELQHYYNARAGINDWNSYEIKFAEYCLDEISANIAQCLEQCKNYMKNGRDVKYLTDRFSFTKKALKNGDLKLDGKITESEKKYIALHVFDEWMQTKYDSYVESNNNRVIDCLRSAGIYEISPNWKKHNELMRKCFKISGDDFWQYIEARQREVFDRITSAQRSEYENCATNKIENQRHVERLENLKRKDYKNYQKTIRQKVLAAKMIKFWKLDR